jgi:hypothetical protein
MRMELLKVMRSRGAWNWLLEGGDQKGEEMRMNARKLKDLAREASKEGGSSYENLKSFVDEIGEGLKTFA